MLNQLTHIIVQAYRDLRAHFANKMVKREVTKVLKAYHATELMQYPQNEWPLIRKRQAQEIQAVASGAMLKQDIIDRRSWQFPYLPEALHRLNQPVLKNTPFNLRRFSETPVARKAINLIKNAILSFDWQIVPASEENTPDDPVRELRIKILTESFKRPNNTDSFRTLLEAVLEDLICLGAGVIEPRMTPYFKRPFKMWSVDGSTIRIFLDWSESTPDRPHFAQMTGLKGERGIVTFLDHELIYIRDNIRTSTPFGMGKLEVSFNTVNAFLSVQEMSFRAGADQVHKTWLWWEPGMNPAQIQTIRRHIMNELEGQAKVSLMAGMKKPETVEINPVTEEDLLLNYQELLIRIIANGFDISPMSLGVERDVNRNTGEVMAYADFRNAVVPMAKRVEEHFNRFIHTYLEWKDLEFQFIGLDDPDSMTKITMQQRKYMMNALTPDEIREEDDRPPLPGGWGKLTQMQLMILAQMAAGMAGGGGGKAGAAMGSRMGGMGMGMSTSPSAGGGAGTGMGATSGMSMKSAGFTAGQVAGLTPEEIELYQELNILPPTAQLGQEMEQEQPGILQQLSEQLKSFFEYEEKNEAESQVQPAEITPEMEEEQEQSFKEKMHQESDAEAVINRRRIFGPALDQSVKRNPVRGKYPKLGKQISDAGKSHYRPGKGNNFQ